MKCLKLMLTALFVVLLFTHNFAQSRVIDYSFPAPSLGEVTKSIKVYYPDGYKPQLVSEKYNLIIYLHGSSGNNSTFMSSVLGPAADDLSVKGLLLPAIIVMPDIHTFTFPSYGDRHLYENSNYYGKYTDVILVDLLNYLKSTSDQNLRDKLLFKKENMAIAGFSMGGDGALRLGFKILRRSLQLLHMVQHHHLLFLLLQVWFL